MTAREQFYNIRNEMSNTMDKMRQLNEDVEHLLPRIYAECQTEVIGRQHKRDMQDFCSGIMTLSLTKSERKYILKRCFPFVVWPWIHEAGGIQQGRCDTVLIAFTVQLFENYNFAHRRVYSLQIPCKWIRKILSKKYNQGDNQL